MNEQFNQVKEFPVAPEVKTKAPLLIKIIAWFMLLGGIFMFLGGIGSLFVALPLLLVSPILIGLQLLIAVVLIVTSFGFHSIKRWALYMFTVITIIAFGSSAYIFFTSPLKEVSEFVGVGIQTLALIYCWSISNKFV